MNTDNKSKAIFGKANGTHKSKIKSEGGLTRVEVIDYYNEQGRVFIFWQDDAKIELDYQDGGRTLKIFINKNS